MYAVSGLLGAWGRPVYHTYERGIVDELDGTLAGGE